MGHPQGLDHLFGVAGLIVLQQCPLQGLALGGLFHEHRLEGVGVEAGVEHAGAHGTGSGVEILHLLRAHVVLIKVLGQIDGILQGAARVAGHEVGHQILLFAGLLAQLIELVLELVEGLDGRFSHVGQGVGRAVFRSHLQLAGDVVLHQLLEEGVVRVGHEVIKTDAAADEHFLHTRQLPHPAQDLEIIAVVHDHVGAGGGGQAVLAAIAHAPQHLLPAGREPEVGGGAADIVDVALEIRLVGHPLGLGHDAVGTAAGHAAALMQLDGAEVAAAEAAAVLDDGELHLPDGRHAAHGLVDGVIPAGVGQGIDPVQLPAHQRLCRDVLDEVLLALLLDDDLAADDILIVHLDTAGFGVGGLIGRHLFEARALHIFFGQVVEVGQVAGAVHIGDGAYRLSGRQPSGNGNGLVFAHAEADDIRAGVLRDAGQDGVQPVIVVGEPPQRGLQTAQDHGQVGVGLLGQPGIHGGAAVRPGTALSAGGVFVLGAGDLGDGVVADHAVHIAAADEEAILRLPEPLEVLAVGIAGLCQYAHLVALGFQQAADDGSAKAGVVHIGVAAHDHKVQLIPS